MASNGARVLCFIASARGVPGSQWIADLIMSANGGVATGEATVRAGSSSRQAWVTLAVLHDLLWEDDVERSHLLWAALGAAVLLGACGDDVTVFNGGTGGAGATTSTSSGDGGTTTSGVGGSGTGGSSTGGGSTGGAPPVSEVPCGEDTCVDGELCCAPMQQGGVPHCETVQTGCDEDEIPISCNGPDDCLGSDVCCVVVNASGGWPPDISPVECVPTCEDTGEGMAFTLCDGPEDCDNEPCQEIPMMPGLKVCGGFGPPGG